MLRQQLSLYADAAPSRDVLEQLRALLDPIQSHLIPLHVTLCRDDEVANLTVADVQRAAKRYRSDIGQPLQLTFGAAEPFSTHGWLMPCCEGQVNFRQLRQYMLGMSAREGLAHITLAHPRNEKSRHNRPEVVQALCAPTLLEFRQVHWISQAPGQRWHIEQSFDFC